VLPENTTLISYFVAAEQTIAFIASRDNFAAVPIAITRQDLINRVATFRSLITLEAGRPADRLADDRSAAAQALYNSLVGPLVPFFPTAPNSPNTSRSPHPSLIIAPHDTLHYLPFAALLDGEGEPLSAQFTLSLIPSASTLSYAQANQNPDYGRLLALSDPITDLPPLPYARREVEALSAFYPLSSSLTGSTATEVAFRAEVSGVDWVHLAAHAQLEPGAPLFSALHLSAAPIIQPPQDATGSSLTSSSDGRLEVREIFNLDLTEVNGVVLSACETGLGEQSRGDELVGLTRAFLYAGTPVVVASLWEVEDEATAALMTSFHQHLRTGLGPAPALRAAQEEVRQNPRWSAPYFWAGFQVIGDGGPSAELTGDDQTGAPVEPQPDTGSIPRLVAGLMGLLAVLGLVSGIRWRRRFWGS
jgi:CHAT domain-containing protein